MMEEKKQDTLLEIKDLKVKFPVHKDWLPAVNGVNLEIYPGEIAGIVGESGSGKSVMSQSILRLRDHDTAVRYEGKILFEGENLLTKPLEQMRAIRGNQISVIFQDPLNSLSPVHTVGNQIMEVLMLHKRLSKEEARKKSIEMLRLTGIPNPDASMKKYPFELSGGMQQRVMIAMALSCDPELLIADEPTTALDVTIQAQIVELLKELKDKLGMAIIFITHDLGVVSEICDKIIVMYAGKVVEEGMSRQIFYERCHPYTEGLLASVPKLDSDVSEKLKPIKGNPPDMSAVKPGCAFAPRCSCAMKICVREEPPECELDETHKASCWQVIKKAMQNT